MSQVRLETQEQKRTKQCGIPVFAPCSSHIGTFSISNKKVWSGQAFEDSTPGRGLSDEHGPVKMSFLHVVHVDSIEDRPSCRGADLPNGTTEGVSSIEGDDGQTLTLACNMLSIHASHRETRESFTL